MEFLLILAASGLATAVVGKSKGSSFLIWFLVGFFVPFIGFVAALLYRREQAEPERRCPRCGEGILFERRLKQRVHDGCHEEMPTVVYERLRAVLRELAREEGLSG